MAAVMTSLMHVAADLASHATAHFVARAMVTVASRGLAYFTWQNREHAVETMKQMLSGASAENVFYIDPIYPQPAEINWLELPDDCRCVLFKPAAAAFNQKIVPLKGVLFVVATLGTGIIVYALIEELVHEGAKSARFKRALGH